MNKPRICIALPGTHYTSHVPHMLMTQPIIPYLTQDYDVTLVFRKTLEIPNIGCKHLTILDETNLSQKERQNRNSYYMPYNLLHVWKYNQLLQRFTHKHAHEFDLVIERQWLLVGALTSAFSHYRVPTLANLEAEFYTTGSSDRLLQQLRNHFFQFLLPKLRRQWLQQVNGVIVETDQMTDFLRDSGYITWNKPITAIPMGVNPDIFYPQNRDWCREQLGIAPQDIVLTYAGSLNRFIQEPGAMIEALGKERPPGAVLHILGDGSKRKELEDIARKFDAPVLFHGRVPQATAALYIGAANLCVAPYNKHLYPDQKFTSASLKVCEYLAAGRLVLATACERMDYLLDGGRYGFYVDNEVNAYRSFFRNFPTFEELSQMESVLLEDLRHDRLRRKGIVLTWRDIANQFKQVINATLSQQVRQTTLRV